MEKGEKGYGKNNNNNKYMKPCVISILLIFLLAITGAVAFFGYLYTLHANKKICQTPACLKSAEHLKSSMNTTAKPCDDFYEFVCGNYGKNYIPPKHMTRNDWFDRLQNYLLRNISEFLQRPDLDEEPYPVHESRTLYRSCMDLDKMDEVGYGVVDDLLYQMGLPFLPPLENATSDFSWVHVSAHAQILMNQEFFVGFSISFDLKNRTVNRIHLSKPQAVSLPAQHSRGKIDRLADPSALNVTVENFINIDESNVSASYAKAFNTYLKSVIRYIYHSDNLSWTEEDQSIFNKSATDLLVFSVVMDELSENFFNDSSSIPVYMDLQTLQEMTNAISAKGQSTEILDWTHFLRARFENATNVTLNLEGEDSTLVVSNFDYILSVSYLLSNTPPQVVEFYMWWTVISTLAPYTNKELRQYNEDFVRALTSGKAQRPRELLCAEVVNEIMGMAVGYAVVHDVEIKNTIERVLDMTEDIQWAFSEDIKNIEWMDNKTKEASLNKLRTMKKYVGYPRDLASKEYLEEYYEGVEMSEDKFLENILVRKQKDFLEMLEQFKETNDFDSEMWTSAPLEVNAFNWIEANVMTVPAGVLQFPFYGHGLKAMDYGAIGTIIGHEMTHGFDNTGKEYDEDGNVNPWWTNDTIREYDNRSECFVNYYHSINFTNPDQKINGRLTLDENIADNGGLIHALSGYRRHVERKGAEKKLMDFDQYTHEQLFFMAYASIWCEESTDKSMEKSLLDEHSPNNARVWGTIVNSEEFQKIWNCPRGTGMNPAQRKCRLW